MSDFYFILSLKRLQKIVDADEKLQCFQLPYRTNSFCTLL